MPATCRADVEALLRARKLDRTLVAVTATSGVTVLPETASTGLPQLDQQLGGGIPLGHFSEIVGPRSSGRTSLLLSLLAATTARGELAALIDTFDVFDAESAAGAGVHLDRLLWVRGETCTPAFPLLASRQTGVDRAIERAVKATNLVLQAGGFSLVALDLADAPVQALRRVPITTWMRLQRVLEGQPAVGMVLGPVPLSRSAGGVSLLLQPGSRRHDPSRKPCERGEYGRTTHASQGPTAAWGDEVGPRATTDRIPEMRVSAASSGLRLGTWWRPDGQTALFRGLESEVQIQRARLVPGVTDVPVRLTLAAQVA